MAGAVDRESAEWLRDFTGEQREAAQARLHAVLVRIARGELRRRAGRLPVSGPDELGQFWGWSAGWAEA